MGFFYTVTLPGVIIHELAHQLFCDLYNIPVYEVCYLNPGAEDGIVGHVLHRPTESVAASWSIALAPLLVNSLVCMLFNFPFSTIRAFGLEDQINLHGFLLHSGYVVLQLIGVAAGIHAMPSNQDVKGLTELNQPFVMRLLAIAVQSIVALFNWGYVGGLLQLFFVYGLITILPAILF